MFNLIKVYVQQIKVFLLYLDPILLISRDSHRVSQVTSKEAIRGLFSEYPISPTIVTLIAIVLLNAAITVPRGHHNPLSPSPSGFPLKTCQFLHTVIKSTTPLNEQVEVFPYERSVNATLVRGFTLVN